MKEVLIITGPCGIGKTTLAKAWAEMKYGAIVECDYLTEWIFDPNFPHWTEAEEKLIAGISAGITEEYLNFGMSVAIENVWSPLGVEILKKRLSKIPGTHIKSIRLVCDVQENLRRDQLRTEENRMNDRVRMVADQLASYDWSEETFLLDTTDMKVEESLSIIDKIQ